MSRFFYQAGECHGTEVTLCGDDAHHLARVLRAAVGDRLELCDGAGACHSAEIISVTKERVTCILGERLPDNEPRFKITLAFGLLKGEKTDFVIQKATELGVSALVPFVSEYCVVRPEKNTEGRYLRMEKIVRAAAAQSRRSVIPAVSVTKTWEGLLETFPHYGRVVLFWEKEHTTPLTNVLAHAAPEESILLITGPEGGISSGEAKRAREKGAQIVTLGPRILRAETAALAALAVSLYQTGEMGGR